MKCTEIDINRLSLTKAEWENLTPITRELELEAAMCAWEALLDRRKEPWEGGAAQGRYCCGQLALAIHIGYCVANVDDRLDGYAYDWDFVPWFIGTCVKWDTDAAYIHGEPELVDDWLDLCRTCLTEPDPEEELSDEDLLRKCLSALNELPNQRFDGTDTYTLAASLSNRLRG